MEQNVKVILDSIALLKKKKQRIVIAIDGRCASGKTTLALELQSILKCHVIHMDDFFLQPDQVNNERLSKAGENVDWERIEREVLLPISRGEAFSYRPYDCHTQSFKTEISGSPTNVTILEGAYSCNVHLWSYADLHVFLTISSQQQLQRLKKRNGEEMTETFLKKWIPLEEFYISSSRIDKYCELVLSGES